MRSLKLHSRFNLFETSMKYSQKEGSLTKFLAEHLSQKQMMELDHLVVVTPRETLTVKCRAGICIIPDNFTLEDRVLHQLAI